MTLTTPTDSRATLAHGYRNLSVHEIRARLDGPLSDNERVTAKAELLRRGADDDGPDTTLATGFAPTSAIDIGAVESEMGPDPDADATPTSRTWPLVLAAVLAVAGGLAWAVHARWLRL